MRIVPARTLPARIVGAFAVALSLGLIAACGGGGGATSSNVETVVIGYQSKTINTVTAGTLLRSLGLFEKGLADLGAHTGKHYQVKWEDYDTGAPITAQMLAGKIDIGSMGDYPLLINGSRAQQAHDARTQLLSVTGYNARGGLNTVVVAPNSPAHSLTDLRGATISTSVGSAAHGTLVQALRAAGIDPKTGVRIENQQPQVGASALSAGTVGALAQFVAWPGLLVFKGQARAIYDGSALGVPTLHGVVARQSYLTTHPDVVRVFLRAQLDATAYLHHDPLQAARIVAAATGLPPEVVYLYNGPNGLATFDATIKPQLRDALAHDVPFLASIGVLSTIDLGSFVNDGPLRQVYGAQYAADQASLANPARITGQDTTCGRPVVDPATASEVWFSGEDSTRPAATPTCLLRAIKAAAAHQRTVRAGYVPDATTGARWFADKSAWVRDPSAAAESRLLPFSTESGARAFLADHPGDQLISYADALAAA